MGWYILTFMAGGFFGVIILCLLAAASKSDSCEGCILYDQFQEVKREVTKQFKKRNEATADYLNVVEPNSGYFKDN